MKESKESILIVDDEKNIRELVEKILSTEGYQCWTAENASAALQLLNRNDIQLVLCDIKMPGMNGNELIKRIFTKDNEMAVIMITAMIDINTAIECMKIGAYDYLLKPLNFDKLIISIERALERRRLIIENREYQQDLEKKVDTLADQIRDLTLNSIKALASALEARDTYTQGHSMRVTQYSLLVGEKLSLAKKKMEQLRLAGLLHDVGKIGVKEQVLNKPGKLTPEEYEQIKIHPQLSVKILQPVITDEEVISIIRHHHERWDGNGFPYGLKKEEIPLGSRIILVCDTFDAMTSNRPYRKALTKEIAFDELRRCAGSQFDQRMVKAFLSIPVEKLIEIQNQPIKSLLDGYSKNS
jgi:putative nucleotidyltransferase with HDIG domain